MEPKSDCSLLSPMSDEWVFPESASLTSDPACGSQSSLLDGDSCIASHLWLETSKDSEPDQAEETRMVPKDIFTFSSRPRSAPHGKSHAMSPEGRPFVLDPAEDSSVSRRDTKLEDDFDGTDSSEEVHSLRSEMGLERSVLSVPIALKRVGVKEWESIAIYKNAADCYVSQQFHRVVMVTQNFWIFIINSQFHV